MITLSNHVEILEINTQSKVIRIKINLSLTQAECQNPHVIRHMAAPLIQRSIEYLLVEGFITSEELKYYTTNVGIVATIK